MEKLFLIVRLSFLSFIFLFVVGCSTTNEPTIEKASSISYLINLVEVELGEGAVSSVPAVVGATPYTFSIAKIASMNDNHLLDPNAITINSSTGVITLSTGNELLAGNYILDVAIANGGGIVTFTSVLTISIIANIPDPTGKWALTSATLVDGNAGTADADPLVIANLDLIGMPDEPIPVGDVVRATTLVSGSLADLACADPAN
jgi:hypothetical protein